MGTHLWNTQANAEVHLVRKIIPRPSRLITAVFDQPPNRPRFDDFQSGDEHVSFLKQEPAVMC